MFLGFAEFFSWYAQLKYLFVWRFQSLLVAVDYPSWTNLQYADVSVLERPRFFQGRGSFYYQYFNINKYVQVFYQEHLSDAPFPYSGEINSFWHSLFSLKHN